MRTITLIIIHCSGVRPGQQSGVKEIDRWHRARGWKYGCGYHFAHCQYHNAHSIGVCYEGGLDTEGLPEDTRTTLQKRVLRALLKELHAKYPKALIVGHNVFDPTKACPCFDAREEYQDLQPR